MEKIPRDLFFHKVDQNFSSAETPGTVQFELTYGCNFRCVHCLNPTHRSLPHELTTEEIFRIMSETAELGVFYGNFTGGELFTRLDIYHILEKAKALGILIGINSNATRINSETARFLERLGILSLGISIFGAARATYEQMTSVEGSYAAFIRSLEILSAAEIPVELRMPVTTLNKNEIPAARELAGKFGFDFSYSLDIEPRQTGSTIPLEYRLSPEEKISLHEALDPEELTIDEKKINGPYDFLDCACGRGEQFAVNPYGEMNFCVSFPFPRFDLRKGSVREGWEHLKTARKNLGPGPGYECPSCEFRPYCRQGRNDAWLETGNANACLPHFKDWARLEKNYILSADEKAKL